MNVRVKLQRSSPGIMGKMILSIQTVAAAHQRGEINISQIKNLNLYSDGQGEDDSFNYVLDQEDIKEFDKIYDWKVFPQMADISLDPSFHLYQEIAKKINIKKEIFDQIPKEIDHNTLGGYVSFDDYLRKVEEVVVKNDIKKIFIASDNLESISKMRTNYEIITNNLQTRHDKEVDDSGSYYEFLIKNSNDSALWNSTFVDAMSLSRCGYIIKGVSSFSSIPIIFSSTIKKVYTI